MSLQQPEGGDGRHPRWMWPRRLLDYGIHPPTMYFPLIVHEALMAGTHVRRRATRRWIDAAEVLSPALSTRHMRTAESMHTAPHNTPIGRPDEVQRGPQAWCCAWRNA